MARQRYDIRPGMIRLKLVAERLSTTPETLRRWARAGMPVATSSGGHLLANPDEVRQWRENAEFRGIYRRVDMTCETEMTVDEIAEAAGLTVGQTRSALNSAMRKIRRAAVAARLEAWL